MIEVIKVKFKDVGKKYFFSPADITLNDGDNVVVETVRGIELGQVVGETYPIEENKITTELKPILRKATEKDLSDHRFNKKSEDDVMKRTFFHIRNNQLEMKLLASEYTLDRSKLIIYFEAEGRVDFRQLVKDLAEEFKVRIELRQVGARDGAKFIGGLGPCGLPMCCVTFIGEFDNVSIKMAKNQNLSLNPQKISGTCGKLLCCIRFEHDTYTEYRETLPNINEIVKTEKGEAKVLSLDVLNRKMKVRFSDDTYGYINADDIEYERKPDDQEEIDLEELKALEA